MKKILQFLFLAVPFLSLSQVGIGTTNPQGAFEVVSTTDGLLIPRIALTRDDVVTVITPTDSELIYNTGTSLVAVPVANRVTPGYYYWNVASSRWIRLANASDDDWKKTGNAGTTAGTNFVGTTDAQDLRFKTGGNDRLNISNTNGQVQSYFAGSGAEPAYSWISDSNTGMFQNGADNLSLTTAGTERFRINNLGKIGTNYPPQAFAQTFSYSNDAAYDALVGYSDIATGFGVFGRSTGAGSVGIYGNNDNNTGYGTYGYNSVNGVGVVGQTAGTTTGTGVQGESAGSNGTGVFGYNGSTTAATLTTAPIGVIGQSVANGGYGIFGTNTGLGGIGVLGTGNGATASDSGAGVFGQIVQATAGNQDVAGVIGLNSNLTLGTGYAGPNTLSTNSSIVGVSGAAVSRNTTNPAGGGFRPRNYHFGVMGETLVSSTPDPAGVVQRRSGGVMGISLVNVFGILGYKSDNNTDYGVYVSSEGVSGASDAGRLSSSTPYGGIGIGAIGGVMGGYVKGKSYGFVAKGDTFGAYIMGNTITNKPIAQIETVNNERVISYATTSTTIDISTRGKGELINGNGFVAFDKTFTDLADLSDENLNITITAKGNTNGIFIERITKDGFYVKENMNGNHTVSFNFSAISLRKGYKDGMAISSEILDANWEENMDGVMFNEADTVNTGKPIHFNGSKVVFEELPSEFAPEARKAKPARNTPSTENMIIKKPIKKEVKLVKEEVQK